MSSRFQVCLCVVALLVMYKEEIYAGNIYKVTSKKGEEIVTYEVNFGGGKLMDQYTAFDPESGKFVYLQWKRSEADPKPEMKIWNHQTGETVELFKFPDAKHPLPIIKSIEEMKVCPITKDKDFTFKLEIIYD